MLLVLTWKYSQLAMDMSFFLHESILEQHGEIFASLVGLLLPADSEELPQFQFEVA